MSGKASPSSRSVPKTPGISPPRHQAHRIKRKVSPPCVRPAWSRGPGQGAKGPAVAGVGCWSTKGRNVP